jgi:hypothetical protein
MAAEISRLIKEIEKYRCSEEEDIADFRAWILLELKYIYAKLQAESD